MPGARTRQECLALSGAAVAGVAFGGASGALGGIPMTAPDLEMIGAPQAGIIALPVSPRTGGRITRVIWTRNPPAWMFDEATLRRATVAPGRPDLLRRRTALLPVPPWIRAGSPPYEEIEQRLATLPTIAVPAVTPGGMADASFPATDLQPVQPPPDSRRSS